MCGILGIVRPLNGSRRSVCADLMTGLGRLEYRGYDSSGVAFITDGEIQCRKKAGKLINLKKVLETDTANGPVGIAHIRWATHGQATDANAHPHTDGDVAVVHNGIIENHGALRSELEKNGVVFNSDTDTEVVLHLISFYRRMGKSPQDAFQTAIGRLTGAFALAVIDKSNDGLLMGARKGSPLVVGHGAGEFYLGSDAMALSHLTRDITFLAEGDQVFLTPETLTIVDNDGKTVRRPMRHVDTPADDWDKGAYDHFMLKEIFEQPAVISRSFQAYFSGPDDCSTLSFPDIDWRQVPSITFVACGTAFYAGMIAQYWIEHLTGIPVHLEIASEFRYRMPPLTQGGVSIFISQSGETADTLAAHKMVLEGGQKTIAVVNVSGSSLAREACHILPTHAGVEIGVASTKALTAQLMALLALGVHIGDERGALTSDNRSRLLSDLRALPDQVIAAFDVEGAIQSLARAFTHHKSTLYIGRGTSYPLAMEAALKLKELTYIHAEGYAAGELKHGPIALIDRDMPTIAIAPCDRFYDKTLSNIHEILARGGDVIMLTDAQGSRSVHSAVRVLTLPDSTFLTAPFIYLIPIQFLSYYVAVFKGTDVDQPRNLAKSVTVE